MTLKKELSDKTKKIAAAYLRIGTKKGVSDQLGIPRTTVYDHLELAGLTEPIAKGNLKALSHEERALPKKGKVKRYLLSCAQNNTLVNESAWANLMALKKHYKAELLISTFLYNTSAYAQYKNDKRTTKQKQEAAWYAPEVVPFICDNRVLIAPGLIFNGEMNIIPTAARPLSGFETHNGSASGIFPHVKIALESIATGGYEPTRLNYTTGTVTRMNYVHRKAGLKAEHHHSYGALLVEVDHEGNWYCRQLNADSDGTIYDLNIRAKGGRVTKGHRVEAMNWGDIHVEELDPDQAQLQFGKGGMLDTLKPKHQMMHDTLSMSRRNHHDAKDHHRMFQLHAQGKDCVREELQEMVDFLEATKRPWCNTVVVDSNHDNALKRWLREADYRKDPANALFFLGCQLKVYQQIAQNDHDFHLVEWAGQQLGLDPKIKFLRTDESYMLAGDIEGGMHGHLGPNGSRGTPKSFTKMGSKANTGHTHSCGIIDGIYTAGTSCYLRVNYTAGPSSWSHSHIVTYPNGKRAILTTWAGKWRADMKPLETAE